MMGLMSLCVLVYCACIIFYTLKFKSFKENGISKKTETTTFSIVIPFRNEEQCLPQLFKSIEQLKYPPNMFEIILVDDHSGDSSRSLCENWKIENDGLNISVLDNKNLAKSPKKSAVLTALLKIKHKYVITTDADCLLPENWLLHFDSFIRKNRSDLIAGPVKMIEGSNFWNKFQVLDLMSLQVIGLGSFKTSSALFCNAANLCYKTQTLKDIQPFQSHKSIVSGDDVFNLEVFQKNKKKVDAIVLREATVWTKAEKNLRDLTQQRMRWASKAKFYKNSWLKALGLIVLMTNLCLVLSLVMAVFFEGFDHFWWLWLFKLGTDFYTLYTGHLFFKDHLCLRDYFMMLLIYPFVSSYFGLMALKGDFMWKGRHYKV